MSIHQNIHPVENRWETIKATLRRSGEGSCVLLELTDDAGINYSFAIHYGSEEYKFDLLGKLKETISELPTL